MNNLIEIIQDDVAFALQEDVGQGDITGQLIPEKQRSIAHVETREQMILAGQKWFDAAILRLDPMASIHWYFKDAEEITAGSILCRIEANSRALLAAERVGLNFLQMLSAVATQTYAYSSLLSTNTKLLDTRKTLPGLRAAQKYAVTCGGGVNHRFGLFDAYLIKENHIKACGSISCAVKQAKLNQPESFIEVEVENLVQLQEALNCQLDRIMLDNFSIEQIEQAVKLRGDQKIPFEVSGNVSLETIKELSHTGVEYISVGAITKSVRAIDLSLLVDEVINE